MLCGDTGKASAEEEHVALSTYVCVHAEVGVGGEEDRVVSGRHASSSVPLCPQ